MGPYRKIAAVLLLSWGLAAGLGSAAFADPQIPPTAEANRDLSCGPLALYGLMRMEGRELDLEDVRAVFHNHRDASSHSMMDLAHCAQGPWLEIAAMSARGRALDARPPGHHSTGLPSLGTLRHPPPGRTVGEAGSVHRSDESERGRSLSERPIDTVFRLDRLRAGASKIKLGENRRLRVHRDPRFRDGGHCDFRETARGFASLNARLAGRTRTSD